MLPQEQEEGADALLFACYANQAAKNLLPEGLGGSGGRGGTGPEPSAIKYGETGGTGADPSSIKAPGGRGGSGGTGPLPSAT